MDASFLYVPINSYTTYVRIFPAKLPPIREGIQYEKHTPFLYKNSHGPENAACSWLSDTHAFGRGHFMYTRDRTIWRRRKMRQPRRKDTREIQTPLPLFSFVRWYVSYSLCKKKQRRSKFQQDAQQSQPHKINKNRTNLNVNKKTRFRVRAPSRNKYTTDSTFYTCSTFQLQQR